MAKKLLNEATIRRFQSLANISPINEMYHKSDDEEKMEETVETVEETIEEMYKEEDEDPADAEMAPEAPEMADEEPEMEMGGEMDVDLTDEEAELLIALGQKLSAAMGDAGEEEMEMDAEEPEEMMEETEIEESLEGINYVPSQTEIVNEVARRVARRLAEAQKAEKKMNEALGRK